MHRLQQFAASRRRLTRVWAVVAAAGAVAFVLARINPMHVILLQDHPFSVYASFLPASLLLVAAQWLLLASAERVRPGLLVAGVVATVLFGAGALVLDSPDAFEQRGHNLAGDVYSADGHYELRVFRWDLGAGQDTWDVTVEHRGAVLFTAAGAGCLAAPAVSYRGVSLFEPGRAQLATDGDPVDITFDPRTMRVTTAIPNALCP